MILLLDNYDSFTYNIFQIVAEKYSDTLVYRNDEINIQTKRPEFLDWKWLKPSDLPTVAVDFKVKIYKKMAEELNSTNLN